MLYQNDNYWRIFILKTAKVTNLSLEEVKQLADDKSTQGIGLFKNERFLADGYDIDDNIDTYCV